MGQSLFRRWIDHPVFLDPRKLKRFRVIFGNEKGKFAALFGQKKENFSRQPPTLYPYFSLTCSSFPWGFLNAFSFSLSQIIIMRFSLSGKQDVISISLAGIIFLLFYYGGIHWNWDTKPLVSYMYFVFLLVYLSGCYYICYNI